MVLRRLTGHVREQNWLAVVLDFAIVVGGVFIGLQAQEWAERRDEAAKADALSQRLAADFTAIVSDLERAVERVSAYAEAAAQVHAQLATKTPPEDMAAFGRMLWQAASSHPPVRAAPTYKEMLATGDLRLLKSAGLRTALVEYHEQAEDAAQVFEAYLPLVLSNTERLDPYVVTKGRDVDTRLPIIEAIRYDGLAGVRHIYVALERANANLAQVYQIQLDRARTVLQRLQAVRSR